MGSCTHSVGVGKRYTTLAGWYADVFNDVDVPSAECYGPGNLGPLRMNNPIRTWTSTEAEPCWIFAAAGHEQDGSRTAGRGAHCSFTEQEHTVAFSAAYGGVRGLRIHFATVEHVAPCIALSSGYVDAAPLPAKVVLERNLISISGVGRAVAMGVLSVQPGREHEVVNNLIVGDVDVPTAGAVVSIDGGDGQVVRVLANSMYVIGLSGGQEAGLSLGVGEGVADTELVRRNNIVASDDFLGGEVKAFRLIDGGTNTVVDFDFDVSCDDSADDQGGGDHIIDVDERDVWRDVGRTSAPLALRRGGVLVPGEGANLTAYGVTSDAVGHARPDDAQYRGGLRYVAPGAGSQLRPCSSSVSRRRRR